METKPQIRADERSIDSETRKKRGKNYCVMYGLKSYPIFHSDNRILTVHINPRIYGSDLPFVSNLRGTWALTFISFRLNYGG